MMPGVGFRGIFPYAGTTTDDQLRPAGQARLHGLLPFFLDVQPSFGFAEHWDVLVDLRFGLGTDFTTSHQFAVAPGFRYWVDPELRVQVLRDDPGRRSTPPPSTIRWSKDNDFGVRNANGFMFEVMRNLGFYIQFGETLGFVRWLRFEIDGGVGCPSANSVTCDADETREAT